MHDKNLLISVKGLEKTYQGDGAETRALRGVSFEIERGDFVAVMGPSGSGKSTLLHMLGFLDYPTRGEYRFEGKRPEDYSESEVARIRNEQMGFVFQSFNLLPRLTVLENVKLPLLYSKVKESEWDGRARAAIELVNLSHRLNHESSKLSGGEKQRVAIARALINHPAVLFADEPTGNLDSVSGAIVMDTLAELNERHGHTIILITHETYAAGYAKRVVTLRDGTIESDETVEHRKHRGDGYRK